MMLFRPTWMTYGASEPSCGSAPLLTIVRFSWLNPLGSSSRNQASIVQSPVIFRSSACGASAKPVVPSRPRLNPPPGSVGVLVAVAVFVGVAVGVALAVGVGGTGVGLLVKVGVFVAVDVLVDVGVFVAVAVLVGVTVGVAVSVLVGVGVSVISEP